MEKEVCRGNHAGTGGLNSVKVNLCEHVRMWTCMCKCVCVGGSLLPFLMPRQKMGGGLSFLFPVSLWALLFLFPTSPGFMSYPISTPMAPQTVSLALPLTSPGPKVSSMLNLCPPLAPGNPRLSLCTLFWCLFQLPLGEYVTQFRGCLSASPARPLLLN